MWRQQFHSKSGSREGCYDVTCICSTKEQTMPQYHFGGETVVLSPRDVNYLIARQQGVTIEVSPQRHWWCLWLCSTTNSIQSIECAITLNGPSAPSISEGTSCTKCGSLSVWGPVRWGFLPPQDYCQVHVDAILRINNTNYEIHDNFLIGSKPCEPQPPPPIG